MKKTLLFIFTSACISACGDSLEADAKKLAELQCKTIKLIGKVMDGDSSAVSESKQLEEDINKLQKKMENKYSTTEEKQKLAIAVLQEMGKCSE